jgi:hypothetical protein
MAAYTDLKRVEGEIDKATTIDRIREIVVKDGPKIGYKAFCYMLGRRLTPEAMKPDEACLAAATLEQEGKVEEALEIYRRVAEFQPDHPTASQKLLGQNSEDPVG